MDTNGIIKNIDIFKGLTEDEFSLICKSTKTRFVKKNTLIFSKGDENQSIYILQKGGVDVFILTETGKELILSSLVQGDYFGELSLLDSAPVSANIMATMDCVFLVINRDDFFHIMRNNSVALSNVISHLCIKIRGLTNKVESFALLDVYHRFTLLLTDLSELNENGLRVIDRSLTHKNIALRIGSSREMVSRIIKDLENGNYISIDHKVITINKKLPLSW